MLVVHGYKDVPQGARGAALAIGNFDGVHRGHQALLRAAAAIGRELGAPAGALIFEPHPREFFHPEEPHFHLTPLPQKLDLFEHAGLDLAVVLPFDVKLASLSADDFVSRIIVGALAARHVIIGHDFFFGRNRGGTPETMQAAAQKLGFGITIIPPVAEDGEVFSSSAIRLHLAQGDVKGATRLLGRTWRVEGTVVGGAKRGTGLGFPTANIPLPRGTTLGHGIYAVRVHLDGARHDGAAYLGTRPTYDDGMPVLEVFLLDFDGDLYGRTIEVEFVDFIRADRKFDSSQALIAQMERDCARARDILAAEE
ncbi:bifunctional riboflavin kinase/FAD synthetase [Hyphomicrobium sp.]|uniref:bifunctional riboflavin kinase/FAD synthetase n=2 Tax=Hyphomicrobium sp. TaxID=82 RepID=UPI00132662C8|nr:bifunctional riboflavin kinase/FAD synthetase [Hyphomicrobium sp.]KAB2939729.1 MAG: bifunctional riboflavin kinase/FAD synthetase [Hyphomicrobium sp.]